VTLPEFAIKRPVTVAMILVSLVVLGTVALTRLPLAFLPDVERPMLFIRLPYPNASPEQVERLVVRPVEEAVGTVSGIKQMWSMCNTEGGVVRLEFDWGTDMNVARAEVWERIDRIRSELPDDIGDITVGSTWGAREADIPIIEGRLSSNRDLSESYDLLERKIVKPLERVPGVAQVRLDGVSPREVRVNLRLEDMEKAGVDVREVARILAGSNFDQSLGWIRDSERSFSLRTIGTFASVDEIRHLPLRADGLELGDIADVRYEQPPLEYGRHLDGRFAVGITVTQEAKANTVQVCRVLEKKIAAMKDDPELEGVNFLLWFSQGGEILKTLRDLLVTGVIGAILASLVLLAFLKRVSATLIAAASIPFSLIVTCGFVWARGATLNTLTLLGLIVGVGMLVDNAVVVMENIFRHREEGMAPREAARRGSREVAVAVTAATLTSVIVFLPLIFNKPSEMNIYLSELGITVCLTLLASLFVSQTLIPLATAHGPRIRPPRKGRLMTALEERYTRMLKFNLRHRWIAPVVGTAVFASAIVPFQRVDKNFDASRSELFVQIRYQVSENLSLQEKEAIVTQVEEALEPHREELMAKSIYSFWSPRWTLTRIYLKEGEASEANMNKVRRRLRQLLPEIPGVRLEVTENAQMWRMDRGKRIAFQLVGEDSEVLGELAETIKQRLSEIPGLVDPFSSNEQGNQELHVEIDRDLASRYGVSPFQPAQVMGLTFRGYRLPKFRTPQGEREMRLLLDEDRYRSISDLAHLPIFTPSGEKVPLASMATFREKPGPQAIQRDNRRTSIWVGARYEKGTRRDYIPKVRALLSTIPFPYGYTWTFGRWEKRRKEQSREFLVNLVLALLLVFVVMASLFESVRQAIALMIALPFAVSGAMWTLYLTGVDFDQPAAIGLLLLIGIVVNNGIVMLEHINGYRRAGMERYQAMVRGGRERLRPILMTATTTLLGLVPILIEKPTLAGVYYYSMALVLMGGLAISTVLTSLLLPTTATLVEDGLAWVGKTVWRPVRWVGKSVGRKKKAIS